MIKIVVTIGLLISFCISNTALGQETNPFPANRVSGQSYTNTSPFKFNYFIGQPVISIPLISYGKNDLSAAVGLSYTATGTRVQQIASTVGLGWSLNTGGYIKRTIVGTPDEFKYIKNNIDVKVGYLTNSIISSTPIKSDLDKVFMNEIDGTEDIFEYSVEGYSGKILLNKYSQFITTIPQSDVSVLIDRLANEGRIYRFIIKLPNGIVYEFSEEELLKYKTKINNVDYTFEYSSTWLPKRTYSTLNPNININYEYDTYYSNEVVGRQRFSSKASGRDNPQIITQLGSFCYGSQGACCVSNFDYINEDIKIDGYLKRLKKITLSDGSLIKFNYTTSRCDMMYDLALDKIEYVNLLGVLTKWFEFDYGYFTATGEVSFAQCNTFSLNNRMVLKRIIEYGSGSKAMPPYEFEYNSTITLPERNYELVDEWGFLPKTPQMPDGGAKAYILNKITNWFLYYV